MDGITGVGATRCTTGTGAAFTAPGTGTAGAGAIPIMAGATLVGDGATPVGAIPVGAGAIPTMAGDTHITDTQAMPTAGGDTTVGTIPIMGQGQPWPIRIPPGYVPTAGVQTRIMPAADMPRHAATKGGMPPPGIQPTAVAGVRGLQGDTMETVLVLQGLIPESPEVPASRAIRTILPARAGQEAIIQEGPDPPVQEIFTAGPEGLTGVPVLPGRTGPLQGLPEA